MTTYEYLDHALANYFAVSAGMSEEQAVTELRLAMAQSDQLAMGVRHDIAVALADDALSWLDVLADSEVGRFNNEDEARDFARRMLGQLSDFDQGGIWMYALERLDALVHKRVGGNKSRLLELFDTREAFELLKAGSQDSDWYHFEPKTFDGQYLVETPDGFQTYQQDRGRKENVRSFATLREAALSLFC